MKKVHKAVTIYMPVEECETLKGCLDVMPEDIIIKQANKYYKQVQVAKLKCEFKEFLQTKKQMGEY